MPGRRRAATDAAPPQTIGPPLAHVFNALSPLFVTVIFVTVIFNGVEEEIIGDFGLSGGGAAGLELDAVDHGHGTPPHALVLASSERHTDLYLMVPEDLDDPAPGIGGTEAEVIRAHMVFFETPRGGGVFSTGSIAWAGSLSHNGYDNNGARITTNVLRRFIDAAPF